MPSNPKSPSVLSPPTLRSSGSLICSRTTNWRSALFDASPGSTKTSESRLKWASAAAKVVAVGPCWVRNSKRLTEIAIDVAIVQIATLQEDLQRNP
eukprot:2756337-Prymnesium_polylepis.1